MKDNNSKIDIFVFILLVVSGVWLRVSFQHIPNFAPIAAISLFSGYFFRSWKIAICVPLLSMAVSDVFIGGYHLGLMVIVYGMLALPVACRGFLRRSFALRGKGLMASLLSVAGLLSCGIFASVLFFVATNFAHWVFTDMYPHTTSGLVSCYVQALPFFRYTLGGDMLFGLVLFGTYAACLATVGAERRETSTV